MKKTKLFGVIAVLGISLAGLVACGDRGNTDNPGGGTDNPGGETPTGKTINLVLSGPADKAEFDAELIEDFKEYRKSLGDPNTYVIEQVAHGEDKVDSEITDWATGPDVYAFGADKTQNLVAKGALAELRSTYKTYVEENTNQVGLDSATFNDTLYAFPYTADNTYYLMYDKSVFTEEDVASVEGILAKCAETGTSFAYKLQEGFYGQGAMFTFGADYNVTFTEDNQVDEITADFNSEKGLKAAKAIYNIVQHQADGTWVDEYILAGTGNTKIAVNGTWDISAAKEQLGENYACAPMPTVTVDGETAHLGCFNGAKLYGVNPIRSANDQDRMTAAFNLAQYLAGPEAQEKRFDEYFICPSNTEVAELDKVKNDPNFQTLMEQSEWCHVQTVVPGAVWNAPSVLVKGIKEGTVTLDNLQEAVDVYNETVINS